MKMQFIKTFFLLLLSAKCYCQYDFIVNALPIEKSKIKLHELKGTFDNISYPEEDIIKQYKFDNKETELTYIENNHSGECDSFILFGKKIGIQGKFDDHLACHLDVTSLRVFTFQFKNRRYFLVESIKNASGTATSFIIFHLFDFTNKQNIIYFPVWSVYGSKSCFGDFNSDGELDFLTIRPISTTVDSGTYKVTLSSIDYPSKKFKSTDPHKYITFRRTYNKKKDMVINVVQKKW